MPPKNTHSNASRASDEMGPNPIDAHIGSRIRLRRNMLGLSQEKLGEAIGLTSQQVQEYERGLDRVGASRLHELSGVLDVPVSFFSTISIRYALRRSVRALPSLRPRPSIPTPCASARQSSSSAPIIESTIRSFAGVCST